MLASCTGDYTDWASPQMNPAENAAEKYGVTIVVNGDGAVDVADVNSIINIMLGKEEVTPTLLSQADLTGDGNVDVSDVNAVINAMLGRR